MVDDEKERGSGKDCVYNFYFQTAVIQMLKFVYNESDIQ